MTLLADVQTAWETKIWSHGTILSYSDKIFDYEITDFSEHEVSKLYSSEKINFIEYVPERKVFGKLIGSTQVIQKVDVGVRYTLEKDTEGNSYKDMRDFFSTLMSLVESQLGQTWNNTVDFYEIDSEPAKIGSIEVDFRPCWQGVLRFSGTIQTSL